MGARVTSKGQVTIPKPVRDRLGITPGSEVVLHLNGDGTAKVALVNRPGRFERWVGAATVRDGRTTDELITWMRGPRADDE